MTASPAERIGRPVDGVEVLAALSPSRASDFMTCPLLYRFRTIDKLPEPFSPAAVRGSVVHKVLEDLFDLPAHLRTPEMAADMLAPAWEAMLEAEPELAEMFGAEGADLQQWLTDCQAALTSYFALEDPTRLEPAEREVYVETLLDSKLLLRGFVDRVDVAPDGRIRVSDYKGLSVETPIPTPTGWTTMGDLAVGDHVFGAQGQTVTVVEKSSPHDRDCYRVKFADGSAVVCDNVHLWAITTSYRQQRHTEVVDTDALFDMHQALQEQGRPRSIWVQRAGALQLPDRSDLPIAPWLLGAWLGDGSSRSGQLTVGAIDLPDMLALVKQHWGEEVSVRRESTAYAVTPTRDWTRCTFGHAEFRPATPAHSTRRCRQEHHHGDLTQSNLGLSTLLRRMNLLGAKRIPLIYLRSGYQQRLDLLRGLMDTDGWWNHTRKRAGFTTTDDGLARDVLELLRSLGAAPMHFSKPYSNPKRLDRTWHVIEFTPDLFNPFALPRKAVACQGSVSKLRADLAQRRIITRVERTAPVPTQCIAVDSPDRLYLCGEGFIPTHNTGKAPHPAFEAKALFQMKFYALVIWRTRGVLPSMLQLIYLGNGEILRYEPDEADLRATERKLEALWQAIRRAEESADWRPSPSRLCDWCSHQALCPAFGGTPPPLPEHRPVLDLVDPAGE